ncbi:MAG: RpiB/LacA/LacB family sugar-phosphate isomerase [Acidobacteriales bacterium]|nr:RpiB/LacA/LacB family sugar-phosphate isomerase [Terriglobales bacterium]
MRVAVGADHAGYPLYEMALEESRRLGHEPVGVNAASAVQPDDDYPDFAELVAKAIKERGCHRGILICGSGVGAAIAANKIPGIRAGLCHDTYSAHQGVEHDNVNVLVLGGRVIGPALAKELICAFLNAQFTGEARHQRRLEKVNAIEARYTGRLHAKESVR